MNSNLTNQLTLSAKPDSPEDHSLTIVHAPVRNIPDNLFYLGKAKFSLPPMPQGYYAENYLAARTKLVRLIDNEYPLPCAIVIDLAFIKDEVNNFVNWLNRFEELQNIPVIYSKSALTPDQLAELKAMRITDDVAEIKKIGPAFIGKAKFLQQAKASINASVKTSLPVTAKSIAGKTGCRLSCIAKRGFDIIVASVLIALLSPILLLIAIAIRLGSRGPVIYTSQRAGKGFKIFRFYKFRTMEVNADQKMDLLSDNNMYQHEKGVPAFFKINNDPRVTKIGSFLRNTSLDELPQLFNVLLGDMSIVGNRPLPLYEAATLTTNEWAERFMAPAGITGLWQIKKRGKGKMSAEERIGLDIDYARKNNIFYDIWIMINTPAALLQKANV